MNTIHWAIRLGLSLAPAPRVCGLLRTCRDTLQEWRQRQRLRDRLSELSDRELMDIGTTRGEIDYVASNRITDPRGSLQC